MSLPTFFPIPSVQLGGAIAANVFALISVVAIASVIMRITWMAIRRCMQDKAESQECVFFNTQLGRYAACLVIAMVFNSIAGIIGLQWVVSRGITDGGLCLAQATTMQIGNLSIGYFTTAIAVHTFNSLVLKKRQSAIICGTTIAIGWIFSVLVSLIPFMVQLPDGPIYGVDDLICGVRGIYPKLSFLFHLLPILIASVLGAVLYSLIFLALRGTLKLKEGIKITLNPNERWNDKDGQGESYHRFIARVSRSMIWYPIAYIALLIPYAVTRLFMISGFVVPFQAVVFAFVCWHMLSIVDVLLLYNTFRVLGPAFDAASTARSAASTRRIDSVASAGNLEKYGLSVSPTYRAAMEEKIQHYRNESFASQNSISTASSRSTKPLLLPLYNQPSQGSPPGLNRSITPLSDGGWEVISPIAVPSPLRIAGRDIATHIRSDSLSSRGLPAPPRPIRAPATREPLPDFEVPRQYNTAAYSAGPDSGVFRQISMRTFGHEDSAAQKSPSIYSDDGENPESWPSPTYLQASQPMTGRMDGQPLLSAVKPSFPSRVYPRSPPQSATLDRSMSAGISSVSHNMPAPRRPLLLARSSPDMRISQNITSATPF
ncbi:hypothetical protein D9613_007870 [Agrocybe pediades]|uniref:G-protein coupled receptors family 2 profile 2 domain-containing protein n=1 Tax=Agrocybe pediades TaxID=84607 RepID=A0A8H4VL62_9AGAR|nr:hypothetical protein D9613_007870 [Agrocybe pediades]